MSERKLDQNLAPGSGIERVANLDLAKDIVRQSIEKRDLELSLAGKSGVLDDHLDQVSDQDRLVESGAPDAFFDWLKEEAAIEAPWLLLAAQGDGLMLATPQRTSKYAQVGVSPFLLKIDFGVAGRIQSGHSQTAADELEVVTLKVPALEVWNVLPVISGLNAESVAANLTVVVEKMKEYAELRAVALGERQQNRLAEAYTKRAKWLDGLQQKRLGQLVGEVVALCKERWNKEQKKGGRRHWAA